MVKPHRFYLDTSLQTIAEIAERYRITERRLRELIQKYQVPVLTTGNTLKGALFDDKARAALEQAMRRTWPLSTSYRAPTAPANSNSTVGTRQRGSAYERWQKGALQQNATRKPTTSKSRSSTRSTATGPRDSNVVAIGNSPKSPKSA
jgi:hypothetical protein